MAAIVEHCLPEDSDLGGRLLTFVLGICLAPLLACLVQAGRVWYRLSDWGGAWTRGHRKPGPLAG